MEPKADRYRKNTSSFSSFEIIIFEGKVFWYLLLDDKY